MCQISVLGSKFRLKGQNVSKCWFFRDKIIVFQVEMFSFLGKKMRQKLGFKVKILVYQVKKKNCMT